MRDEQQPWILGLAFSHNGGACLLHGDRLVVAVQEERLTRAKRSITYPSQPMLSVPYCLAAAGIGLDDIAVVAACGVASRRSVREGLQASPMLGTLTTRLTPQVYTHHLAHAAHAVAVGRCERAVVLVVDGRGTKLAECSQEEQQVAIPCDPEAAETASLYRADRGRLIPLEKHVARGLPGIESWREASNVASPGGMYERVARDIFNDRGAAGKVMGLAPFGRPVLDTSAFFRLSDGTFQFGPHPVLPANPAEPDPQLARADLAASVQAALETAMLFLVRRARTLSDETTLCLSGGVALNGVANERILREGGFARVVLPGSVEDNGTAVGAAYLARWQGWGWRPPEGADREYLGRSYDAASVDAAIAATPRVRVQVLGDRLLDHVVSRLADGDMVGWLQGGSELGPRALGNRSILCDPRRTGAKERLNARVKRREGFRPFAPVVLLEAARDWFELDGVQAESPYMTRVVQWRCDRPHAVPAVVHVDGSGRLQTVTPDNGRLHELLRAFHARTGMPILLNTSFNLAGEPIVETPADALLDLMASELDCAVLGDRLVERRSAAPCLLDLVPVCIGSRIDRASAEERGFFSPIAIHDTPWVQYHFLVETPWGELVVCPPKESLGVLLLLDGKQTGRELVERAVQHRIAADRARFESMLLDLVRLRIIALRDPDDGSLLGLQPPPSQAGER